MSAPTSIGDGGKWLAKGLWQQGALLYFAIEYITGQWPRVVCPALWNLWARGKVCPDLDPAVNGGKVHAMRAPRPAAQDVWVLLQSDVEQIVRRRTEAQAGKTDPAGTGRWIAEGVFQLTRDVPDKGLRDGELLLRDRALAAASGLTYHMAGHWRRHRHPALEPSANGGRLRHLEVPKPRDRRGTAVVFVSSQADWDKIVAWRQRVPQETGGGAACRETAVELARRLKLRRDRWGLFDLRTVLRQFRREAPAGARLTTRRDAPRNRAIEEYRYDPVAFVAWLGGRDVRALALELRRTETPEHAARREGKLRKAVAFLQFVLTRGRYSARLLGRFLAHPPAGQTLHPCAGVPAVDILRWAREAGIDGLVYEARKALPVEYRRRGNRGPYVWRLTAPVVIPVAARPAAFVGGSAGKPKNPGGRPVSERAERVQRHCYEGYTRGDKLSSVRAAARLFGEQVAPKQDGHVTTYARRYAERNGLPFRRVHKTSRN
jgi:hypothetical protein